MSNANTVLKTLQAGVVTIVKSLSLASDDGTQAIGDNVYEQQVATEEDSAALQFPAVVVWTPANDREQFFGGSTEQLHWYAPISLAVVDHESFRDESRDADFLEWRRVIWRRLHQKRNTVPLPSPFSNNWCEVIPGPMLANKLGPLQYLSSALTLKFWIIEPR